MEVPPGELPYERLGARTAHTACPVDQFDRRQRAEVQMGENREVASPGRSSWRSSYAPIPSRSQAVSRFLASVSPPRASPSDTADTSKREGIASEPTPSGTRRARGAATGFRNGCRAHRRWYGVKTAKWSEAAGVTAPGASAVTTASWTCRRRPSDSSAARSRSSLRCA